MADSSTAGDRPYGQNAAIIGKFTLTAIKIYTCILFPVIASKVLILDIDNHCNKCSLCSKYPYYKEICNFVGC